MTAAHTSPFSGSWYPGRASDLESLLDGLFSESKDRYRYVFPGGLGFVVPHAGPSYSGTVAAAVYRSIAAQEPERVVILAFPHRGGLKCVAAPEVSAISTPLGDIEIDSEFGGFPRVDEARVCDHSFEIQIPFLQRAGVKARVTALYVGGLDEDGRVKAAEKLAALWRPGTVFVASSDFTHFGRSFGFTPFPADEAAPDRLHDMDFACIEAAGSLRGAAFLETLDETGATVCGSEPIALLVEALRRIDPSLYCSALDYQTSGELTGDFKLSVSYAALGFFPSSSFDLPRSDCEALLDSASETIGYYREHGERRRFEARGCSSALSAKRGAFVTLRQGDELLGCVGNVSGKAPLSQDISELALSAALDDPRFKPATSARGPIDLEISVLTPLRRIYRAEECVAGKHGIFLRNGKRAGLLLPQVAAERGWDANAFLEAVSSKSSLGKGGWRDPKSRLSVFEAQVFSRKGAIP